MSILTDVLATSETDPALFPYLTNTNQSSGTGHLTVGTQQLRYPNRVQEQRSPSLTWLPGSQDTVWTGKGAAKNFSELPSGSEPAVTSAGTQALHFSTLRDFSTS